MGFVDGIPSRRRKPTQRIGKVLLLGFANSVEAREVGVHVQQGSQLALVKGRELRKLCISEWLTSTRAMYRRAERTELGKVQMIVCNVAGNFMIISKHFELVLR